MLAIVAIHSNIPSTPLPAYIPQYCLINVNDLRKRKPKSIKVQPLFELTLIKRTALDGAALLRRKWFTLQITVIT